MKLRIVRKTAQIAALLMLFVIPALTLRGVSVITGGLYSLSIGPLTLSDPLSVLQVILSTLTATTALVVSAMIPLAIAFIFGRVFCSWVCPQNTLSEFFDFIARRAGVQRALSIKPTPTPRYVLLVILLAATPLAGFPVASLLSLPGMLSVQATRYMYEGVVGAELTLAGIIILLELFIARRVWCNTVCPVGSLLGVCRTRRTMKVAFTEDEKHVCGRCFECKQACQLALDPTGNALYPLCHNCGECIAACGKATGGKSPLSFKF